jgi:hypothetical protein
LGICSKKQFEGTAEVAEVSISTTMKLAKEATNDISEILGRLSILLRTAFV